MKVHKETNPNNGCNEYGCHAKSAIVIDLGCLVVRLCDKHAKEIAEQLKGLLVI